MIICFGLTSSARLHQNPGARVNDDGCKAILDSAKVMVENGTLTIHQQIRSMNYERFTSVSIWIDHRPFNELKCLLESKNPLYRMYGYVSAGQLYLDSLDKGFSHILNDTTSLQMITPDGLKEMNTTIGGFLKMMHRQIEENNADFAKRPLLESKVKAFINQYAKYPESYQPVSFPFFSMGSETGGAVSDFRLRHLYRIENNRKKPQEVMSEFVFDASLNIRIIAKDSTNLYRVSSPHVSEWLSEYGRTLTAKDSAALSLN